MVDTVYGFVTLAEADAYMLTRLGASDAWAPATVIESTDATASLIRQMFSSGENGLIGVGTDALNTLKVTATTPAGMSVLVDAGFAVFDGAVYEHTAESETDDMTAPVGLLRIDAVAWAPETDTITIHGGVEAASPAAPSIGEDELLLAWVYHRAGETSIKNTNDSTNGYIVDKREVVNM
jgi:hypothetical protein